MPWLVHPRDWEELYHYFYRRMPMRISETEIKDHIEKQRQDNADQVVRALRADLAAEAWRLHGMNSRMPVLVCHAESVLALHVGKKLNLANIYEQGVSLSEFFLTEDFGEQFGDDNPELVDAIMRPKPKDYIRRIVRDFVQAEHLDVPAATFEQPPTRAVVQATVNITTGPAQQG